MSYTGGKCVCVCMCERERETGVRGKVQRWRKRAEAKKQSFEKKKAVSGSSVV